MSGDPQGWSPILLALLARLSWYTRFILAPITKMDGRVANALNRLYQRIQIVVTTPDGIRVRFRPLLKGDLPQVMTMFRPINYHKAVGLSQHWTSGIIVEAGAHIGAYALRAAQNLGNNGRVVAIEPDPDSYALLEKNIALNHFHNIIAIRAALSDQDSQIKLFLGEGAVGNTIINSRPHTKRWVMVPTARLDTIMDRLGLKSANFIRMAVEGAELEALKGATSLLSSAEELRLLIGFGPLSSVQSKANIPLIEQYLFEAFETRRRGSRVAAVKRHTRMLT